MAKKVTYFAGVQKAIQHSPLLKALRSYPTIELAAAGVGLLAVLLLFVVLLVPQRPQLRDVTITAPLSVGTPDFINALAGLLNAPIHKGHTPIIFNNGDEFVPALIDSIDRVKSTINITDFIWVDGAVSKQVFSALQKAADRGVAVRILVDAQQAKLPDESVKALEHSGGKVGLFRKLSIRTLASEHKRTHRRAFIFDGTEAYLGGFAIRDDWQGNGLLAGHWRDMMFKVDGVMAQDVQAAFADSWFKTTGEVLAGAQFYPTENAGGSVPYINVVSTPSDFSMPIRSLLLVSIISAQKKLYIENPYFLPDTEIRHALEQAAKRGVDVRIIVPMSGWSMVQWASETNFSELLYAGVKIYRYKTLIHTKTLTADSLWSVIGSANFDNRSRVLNDEYDMGISDAKLASQLEATFAKDAEFADELTREEWRNHRILFWFRDHLAILLGKQI